MYCARPSPPCRPWARPQFQIDFPTPRAHLFRMRQILITVTLTLALAAAALAGCAGPAGKSVEAVDRGFREGVEATLAAVIPMTGRYVVSTRATLRPRPTTAGAREFLPTGTLVTVTGRTGEWYRITLDDGRRGFAASRNFVPAAPGAVAALAPTPDQVVQDLDLELFAQVEPSCGRQQAKAPADSRA